MRSLLTTVIRTIFHLYTESYEECKVREITRRKTMEHFDFIIVFYHHFLIQTIVFVGQIYM